MDTIERPDSQGGVWYIGRRLRILDALWDR
jgi:hypothetical protein